MRLLAAAVLWAGLLQAQTTVYFSAHGKTYHASAKCMALSHTANVLSGDQAVAEKRGLRPCKICHRVKQEQKTITEVVQ